MLKRICISLKIALISCLLLIRTNAADEISGNPEFQRLRSTYETELQKINDSDLAVLVSEQERYLAALRNLQKQMQQAGKLEPVLAIGNEIDRFAAAKKIEPQHLSRDVSELVPLQNAYIKSVEKYPLEQAKKMVLLSQNYEKALGNLQEVLTKKGDIRGAVEVKTEKEAVGNSPQLMAARALIAETEEKAAAAKAATTPDQPAGDAGKGQIKAGTVEKALVKKKYTSSPEKRVKQRYDEFVKALLKQDYSAAAEFVDPAFVRIAGQNATRNALMGLFPVVQIADNPRVKLAIDSVKLNSDGDKATLVPKIWVNNQWHTLQVNNWIETEGDWYLTVRETGEEMRPRDLNRMERDEPGPAGRRPIKRFMDKR